jgi:DNA-binding transcriptional MerR regulator
MGQYSIKQVETLSGVKAHTIRIWEQRYHFLKPDRTDTNIRYYSDEQLKLVLNIATLNRSGMKISKIAGLKQTELNDEVLKVFEADTAPNGMLDSIIHSMLDFDEKRFEKTLITAITKLGFEGAFTDLVFPFLERTGALWATGAIHVGQEHFITNLIRRKISAATDAIYSPSTSSIKKYVLFLPEGETHELLLLFMEYLLRKHNYEVVYLGISLPFEELGFVVTSFKPDYLVTYQTVAQEGFSYQSYLKKLSDAFPQCKIIISGSQLSRSAKLAGNCIPVHSFNDFLKVIN